MDKSPRHIDILLFDDLNILEIAGPAQTFTSANELDREHYRLRYVSADGASVRASCGLELGVAKAARTGPGTQDLLIPGGRGVDRAMQDKRIRSLIANWTKPGRDRRVISVCSGALLTAAAGILDDRKATTHWGRQTQAVTQFPKVDWAIDQLYCIDGNIMTSAGVTSGIDLALEIVRQDCGASVALSVARQLVVYLKRDGGQAQFSDLLEAQFASHKQLGGLLDTILHHPERPWTLELMADHAGMTPRTLMRKFSAALGKSPHKFLERVRVKRASAALSAGAPVNKAIEVAGFTDFQQMQRAFKRQIGTTVGTFRARFDASA